MTARTARFAAFATLGALSAAQDLTRGALEGIESADPALVGEETLCLVAVATARAAEVGLRGEPAVADAVIPVLMDLPLAYRDYMIGSVVVADPEAGSMDFGDEYERLGRKREFYRLHLPSDQFPGERLLTEKLALWMGRISPPGLPEMPQQRLERLGLVGGLLVHLKLVLAYGRQGDSA